MIIATTLVLSGCGAQATVTAPRMALMPSSWRTRDPWPALDERAMIRRGLGTIETVDAEPGDEICDDEAECARRAGREADADRVVVTTMASLGETVLARVSVIDLRGDAEEESRQRVIDDASEARVAEAMTDLGRAIAEPYLGRRPQWYEEWWPWTIGAVVLAGVVAAIAGVVVATDDQPDVVVIPP